MSNQFEVGGHKYAADPMSTITQFHVTRRLSTAVEFLANVRRAAPNVAMDRFVRVLCGAMSPLPQEDCDYALEACLSRVKREDGAGWAKIKSGDRMMFADITMENMLEITYKVLETNGILDFFQQPLESGSASPDEGQA